MNPLTDPIKATYADPPYLGCAVKHYGLLHDSAADFDDPATHRRLIEQLCEEFDAWALSLNEPSLRVILPLCPSGTRIGAWVKPFVSYKPNVTRAYAWEPVIFRFAPSRPRTRDQQTWRDFIHEPVTLRRGVPGAKPARFAFWIFEGLNLRPDDHFHDLFPGSQAVSEAWARWKNRHDPTQCALFISSRDVNHDERD